MVGGPWAAAGPCGRYRFPSCASTCCLAHGWRPRAETQRQGLGARTCGGAREPPCAPPPPEGLRFPRPALTPAPPRPASGSAGRARMRARAGARPPASSDPRRPPTASPATRARKRGRANACTRRADSTRVPLRRPLRANGLWRRASASPEAPLSPHSGPGHNRSPGNEEGDEPNAGGAGLGDRGNLSSACPRLRCGAKVRKCRLLQGAALRLGYFSANVY